MHLKSSQLTVSLKAGLALSSLYQYANANQAHLFSQMMLLNKLPCKGLISAFYNYNLKYLCQFACDFFV